jgi:hypothetical protein
MFRLTAALVAATCLVGPVQAQQWQWQETGPPYIRDLYYGHEQTFPCSTDPEFIRRGTIPCPRSPTISRLPSGEYDKDTKEQLLCFRMPDAPGCE